MNEKLAIDHNSIEINAKEKYQEYLNTRSENLRFEGIENGSKMRKLMVKFENHYVKEYEDAIEKIFNNNIGSDDKVKEIFDICSKTNFDISNAHQVKNDDEKGEIFWKIIEKIKRCRSLNVAIEQQKKNKIKFKGFNKDKDFFGINDFLQKSFPGNLLDNALISRLTYLPDIVCISMGNDNYYLPKDKYIEWKNKYKDLIKYKTRASNIVALNKNHHNLFCSTPIEIYSFIDEDLNNFEYLRDLPEEKKMQAYKLGTVSHEVGHNLYINLLDKSSRDKWQKLIDSTGHLTHYSEKYSSGIHGVDIRYDEEFAEAIRLVTTNQNYLKQKFFEIYEFLINIFPELKNN